MNEVPEQEQLACIFCGRNVLLTRIDLNKLDNWDISWKVLITRDILPGPGKGHRGKQIGTGFPAIDSKSLSIIEMVESDVHPEVVEAIKKRLVKIVRAYVEAGIIAPSEIL